MPTIENALTLLSTAFLASSVIGCGTSDAGGEGVADGTQEIVIDQSDIDALDAGQNLALPLAEDALYTFDVTQGPLDFNRVRLTMDGQEAVAMDELLERRPDSVPLPEGGRVEAVSVSLDPAALQGVSPASDQPALSPTAQGVCNVKWSLNYCDIGEWATVCVNMTGSLPVPC